ncbi:hypothetical protein HAX54_022789 [Datura stramonium]|uniref:Replication factor-A protein 1 N-terminal domain-containing protein n=1 Tax=Datura stramonium TaxID=4076 RepID=A0ABS8UWF0_DATST|nr:hypothetical protein [Datura stramonium]
MISLGGRQCEEIKPVLQITDVRLVNSQSQSNNNEGYRILISDGQYIQQGMLAKQNNDLVLSQRIQKGTIIQMKEFVRSSFIIDLDILLETCDEIGEPQHFLRTHNSTPPSVPRPGANQLGGASVYPQSLAFFPSSAPAALQDSSTFQIARLLLENEQLRLDNENLRAQIARDEEIATARHNDLVTVIKGLSRTTTPSTF